MTTQLLPSFLAFLSLCLAASATTPPGRALSQVPSITEILYALGQQDRIVGVSKFCRFPPEAEQKPKIGGLHDADIEKILTLQPDWAALFLGQDKVGNLLTERGCKIYYCQVETISEMYASIREVGEDFGVDDRAAALVDSISSEIADVRRRLSDLPRKKVLYVVGREPGSLKQLYGAGKHTFLAEMIEAAGGDNCVEPGLGKYPVLSREAVIVANPEVILDGGAGKEEIGSQTIPPEWAALASIRAVKEGNIHMIDDPHLTIPGPSIPESIRKLAVLIHGQAAADRLGHGTP
jgi:iron complex transport system substrate-binding protein